MIPMKLRWFIIPIVALLVACSGGGGGLKTVGQHHRPHPPVTRPHSTTTTFAPQPTPTPPGPPSSCTARGPLPDPRCTPGEIDPRVTQANIHQTICVSGYTSKVRPPVSVTGPIKIERMAAYGFAGQSLKLFELDHLIPLEVGGASSVANLWPEVYAPPGGAHEKDLVENRTRAEVCSGKLTLADAQHDLATDWQNVP